jgi:hypothetical protein
MLADVMQETAIQPVSYERSGNQLVAEINFNGEKTP